MKNLSLSIMLAFSAQSAYGDGETVVVTGSRIPYESAGLVWSGSGGPNDEQGHGCAQPNCGEMPNDPSGGAYTSHASKNQRNKIAKQKVQQKPAAKQAVKNTKQQSESTILATIERWFGNLTVTQNDTEEVETPSGKILKNTKCRHIDFAQEKGPNPCVERQIDVEKVLKANGDLTNQLQLSFVLYDECYYAKKCGPEYITFVAESESELHRLLNDALGENYF